MRTKILILLLLSTSLSLLKLNAQCADCNDDDSWRFAAGVTLHSNNKYVSEYNSMLERQPLELNFRYKLNDKHILRLNLPFSWKVNVSDAPDGTVPQFIANTGNKANDYYEGMKHDYWYYADFSRVESQYYNLFGTVAGYSFNQHLLKGLSAYIGVDFSCVLYHYYAKYFSIGYTELNDNNMSELRSLSYVERVNKYNTYSAKPLLGANYQYKNLMLDVSAGYSLSTYKVKGNLDTQSPESSEMYIGPFERNFKNFQQFIYQISLFYTF